MIRRAYALCLVLGLPLAAGVASSAHASTITVVGVIAGSDGRAVDALLGLDVHDSSGRPLNADGSRRTKPGYGIVLNVNSDLPPEGSPSTAGHTTSWSAALPSNAATVFVEAYPRDQTHTTNEARYGHAMRHNVSVHSGTGTRIDVRLPLICASRGTTGTIRGTATRAGHGWPLTRVVGWSMDGYDARTRPVLGWNVGTAKADGSYVLPNLASGQHYQVWTTAADGTVITKTQIAVQSCATTVSNVSYDPPPPGAPALSPSTITVGQSAHVSGWARPGANVQLLAYSRPATTYTVVRRGTASSTGAFAFDVRPATNTRLLVSLDGRRSNSTVLLVRPAVTLSASRTATRTYSLVVHASPARTGQWVSVYAQTASGPVRVAQGPVGSTGSWSGSHRFTSSSAYSLYATTGGDITNAAGRSAIVRTPGG